MRTMVLARRRNKHKLGPKTLVSRDFNYDTIDGYETPGVNVMRMHHNPNLPGWPAGCKAACQAQGALFVGAPPRPYE